MVNLSLHVYQYISKSEAIESFNILKNSLISKDIILAYPNFDRDFEFVCVVLSQNNIPIAFISRTLNRAEEHYTTNEKKCWLKFGLYTHFQTIFIVQ